MSGIDIGVLDLGSARFKASVWQASATSAPAWSSSIETADLIKESAEADLLKALTQLAEELRDRAQVVVAYGASLVRSKPKLAELFRPELVDVCDAAFIVSAEEEGALLVAAAGAGPGDLLLDVGGGSVQLAAWPPGSLVRSWPLGTRELEKTFSLAHGSNADLYWRVRSNILSAVADGWERPAARLVVGSNIMADFFGAVGARMGIRRVEWSVSELDAAWQYCASLRPAQFAMVFPQNPNFLYGGDKAFLVAAAFADALNVPTTATNASVAQGMASRVRAALSDGRWLDALDFETM